MNKTELIAAIAEDTKMTLTQSAAAVDAFIKHVGVQLQRGNDVRLSGFGTFSAAKRKAREGRNPQTGQSIRIPATTVPKFKPGKGLRSLVG